jgi:hypothetical protein
MNQPKTHLIYSLLYKQRDCVAEDGWRIYIGQTNNLEGRIDAHMGDKNIRCLFVLKRGCEDAMHDEQALTEAVSLEMQDYMHIEGGPYSKVFTALKSFYAHHMNLCNNCLEQGHYFNTCKRPKRELDRPLDAEKAEKFLRFVSVR